MIENKDEIIYGIARKESVCYGHGDYGTEMTIRPMDGYYGGREFHPFFRTKNEASDYILTLGSEKHQFCPVQLTLKVDTKC